MRLWLCVIIHMELILMSVFALCSFQCSRSISKLRIDGCKLRDKGLLLVGKMLEVCKGLFCIECGGQ